jgi:3-oxoacyl-[acyl-carrier-protein] synthase III
MGRIGLNKYAYYGLMLIFALLSSCGTKRRITESSKHELSSLVDSTKSISASTSTSVAKTDTSKTVATAESTTIIIFADGGGAVTIDSTGVVRIEGVKSIKNERSTQINESNAMSELSETNESSENLSKAVATQQESDSTATEIKRSFNNKTTTIIIVILLLCLAGFFAYKWRK